MFKVERKEKVIYVVGKREFTNEHEARRYADECNKQVEDMIKKMSEPIENTFEINYINEDSTIFSPCDNCPNNTGEIKVCHCTLPYMTYTNTIF